MNRRKQTPIRFLALVMAIATITSFSFRWFVIKTGRQTGLYRIVTYAKPTSENDIANSHQFYIRVY